MVDLDVSLIWITLNATKDINQAVFDTLPTWVPAVKARGTKVALFGISGGFWRERPAVEKLLAEGVLYPVSYTHLTLPPILRV